MLQAIHLLYVPITVLCLYATRIDGFVLSASRTTTERLFILSHNNDAPNDEKFEPSEPPATGNNNKNSSSRRDVLRSVGMAAAAGASSSSNTAAAAVTTSNTNGLLLDLPMIRLKLPKNALGADYAAVQLCLPDQETPIEVMLDTGLTLEMITPHLQQVLNLKEQPSGLQGLAAGGATTTNGVVTLQNASLCDPISKQTLKLSDLHATVQDFPQEHIDPKHDPVEGMLGQEVLTQYDLDLDFPAGRVRLYQPGTAPKTDLVEIPAIVINETGLLGFRLRSGGQQPIVAFLDCGSSFSAVNWQAAGYLGLPTNPKDAAYRTGPSIVAIGVDGRPMELPTIPVPFTFAGNAIKDSTNSITFEAPPSQWQPWKPVHVAVGDLPVFPLLLGDGVHPYTGPAALIGLDVLSQRRVILESAGANAPNTRRRRIFVSPE